MQRGMKKGTKREEDEKKPREHRRPPPQRRGQHRPNHSYQSAGRKAEDSRRTVNDIRTGVNVAMNANTALLFSAMDTVVARGFGNGIDIPNADNRMNVGYPGGCATPR